MRMANTKTYHGNTNPYTILSDEDVKKIKAAVFELMLEIGIKFDSDKKAMQLFSEAGCSISSDGIVRFPRDLVERSIDTVGKSVKIWDRDGKDFIEFNTHNTIMMAGTTCTDVVDYKTGVARIGTCDDMTTAVNVADYLSGIDSVTVPFKIEADAKITGQIQEFAALLENTRKPLMYLSEDVQPLSAAIEMSAVLRGGERQLRQKPYFSYLVSPLPLHYQKNHIEQIFLCVENGIPIVAASTGVGGASTPITIAGNVTHCLANDFSCIVLSQLIEKGSFCACSTVPAFINPASGLLGGFPETSLAELARCQVLRDMGLPIGGSGAGIGGGSNYLDGHNISVAALFMMSAAYSRPGLAWGLGCINSMNTFSLQSLIYCSDLVGWVRRLWKGVLVNEDTLAMDVTRNVGVGDGYMAGTHTAIHCRTELWQPDSIFYYEKAVDGVNTHDQMIHLLDDKLRTIINTHKPDPLPESIAKRINEIMRRYDVE